MRTRASVVLALLAILQVVLLGTVLALLVLKLRTVEAELIQLGREEQTFLNRLADTELDLYRTSILLRDYIILNGPEQIRARQELVDVLGRISAYSVIVPQWLPSEMRIEVSAVEAVRADYLARARGVTLWQDSDRKTQGPRYLSLEMAPTREKFTETAKRIVKLVRSLREARNDAAAALVQQVETLIIRSVTVSAILGLALATLAIWRFRSYEDERDIHIGRLEQAENALRGLSQSLVESQEMERKKLSRELHDEVGQTLTALRVQLGQVEPPEGAARAHLDLAAELAERSLRSIREMARGLRPAMLDDLGLAPALQWLGRDFSKNTRLNVEVELEGEFSGLDERLRTCLYRVTQEALTNCVRHSRSASARVLLHESPGELVLTVQDNGVGFDGKAAGGVGLLGMRERIEELGGELAVISSPHAGTLIRARLPREGMGTT